MPSAVRRGFLAVILATSLVPARALGQGAPVTREPPLDFSSNGVWRTRARRIAAARTAAMSRGEFARLNAALRSASALMVPGSASSAMAVTGTLRVPVILIRFADTDTTQLRDTAQYSAALFGNAPPAGQPFTVTTFYEQMSQGLFSMSGRVYGWVALDNNMSAYTGPASGCTGNPYGTTCNGIWSSAAINAMQGGLAEALQKVDAAIDFGQYDSDGPDGIPNSGDDDGVVDMAVFVQAAKDGACLSQSGTPANNNLWSHRFFLGYDTNDPRAGGGDIAVSSYTLQSAVGGATACDSTQIMPIGTIAHETGHGLGLPDFYDTDPTDGDQSEGIGHWGLMASGNYAKPYSPAHMEGFSRMQLGWVAVRDLSTPGDYSLGAYTVSDTVFRIQPGVANPRGEYFLLENRQATDGDTALIGLKGPGLLIWHVDSLKYYSTLFSNRVNSGSIHALWLMQADGLNQLRSSTVGVKNRGDAGDPFPGSAGNTRFDNGTNPGARLNTGSFSLISIDSIQQQPAGPVSFRLQFIQHLTVADTALHPGVMGTPYVDTLTMVGGTGPTTFLLLGGNLPPGLQLGVNGIIQGTPAGASTYTFVVRVFAGPDTLNLPMRMVVSSPTLVLDDVVNQLVDGGTHLTPTDLAYLDLLGNNNGHYDVGDFTAWVDATGVVVSQSVKRRVMARGAR